MAAWDARVCAGGLLDTAFSRGSSVPRGWFQHRRVRASGLLRLPSTVLPHLLLKSSGDFLPQGPQAFTNVLLHVYTYLLGMGLLRGVVKD